ncbi:MAG: ATP-dependent helicase DeaD [Methanolobus sp.]|jgi:ATP-dependent RNA helicase DeaD|uniref:RNA helicase n=1 Tax=Methanolobus tindarius DSM 2278 TaxID=1090322 RepID=W9DRG1_METTI|nr:MULTISPECIES: DEAD/DEAH box helicase [Methanolobus]ETA69364.1 DNA/RNA helicase, superfamily II [Methanolobus tindarius DSM 2278]MDK2830368.1 ATP-dependent helicase DeaD [Methanolobus sp.]MDK2938097.1 ATP-dependent helicase DeaD [Methanolobus sp.]
MESSTFKDLHLSRNLEKAIEELGFEEPTPIQTQAIPFIMEGRDVIGQAQTGTGKTAAFGIPALEMVNPNSKKTQALVLCPTRELANQVAEELGKLAKYLNVKILPVYGGQNIDRQIKALRRGVHIVIGTPGRVMDHIERKTLKLNGVDMIVLDEADEMLDMGFREDIETILSSVPDTRQTIFFSATMPKPIMRLTKQYQQNPTHVKTIHKVVTAPNMEQSYFEVKHHMKPDVLCRMIDIYDVKSSLVFCNTKRMVDDLVTTLKARGYLADGLHGDMKQNQREKVMASFRNGEIETLVATDVAARGIDVENIEVVFNFDMPQDEESYVHRIGRTGRAGRQGIALTFVTAREIYKIKSIQKYTKTKIKCKKVPTRSDAEEIKAGMLANRVKETIDEGHLGKYVHWVEKMLDEDCTTMDIAAGLVKIMLAENR